MKKTKQTTAVILSLVLLLSTVLGQLPASIRAAAASYGISNPRTDSSGVTTWDCIWFGNYWQSNKTTKEPIKWRVLSVDGDDAFLLADQNLDAQPYHTELTDVTWETCSLRTWLNTTFYQNAFSSAERAAIRTTTVVNEDNPYYKTEGGNDTQDKVYLLSIAEASNAAYGFHSTFNGESETRCSKNTEYAKGQGVDNHYGDSYAGNGDWWLRSLGGTVNRASGLAYNGWGSNMGSVVNYGKGGVRPALHIDLSSSTWSKAGTVSSSGGSAGGVTASPIPTANPSVTPVETTYGISNPRTDSSGVTTWDCIWFGNYWQSSETAKEPIKWRVLSVDGDDAFLLADQNLDAQPYNTKYTFVTWETCSLRTWLNTTFYQNAFSSAEQAAIRTTTVINEDNPVYGTEGGNNTWDKVYLLSIAEASNAAYGFHSTFDKESESETRYSKNTEYAKGQGAYTSTSDSYAGNGWWWLRSPGEGSNTAAFVYDNGWGIDIGMDVYYDYYAVRPALHIDLSSSPWSKAGTVGSSGGSAGGVTASPIPTANPSATPSGSSIPTANPSATPSGSSIPTAVPSATPSGSTPTANPSATPSGSSIPTAVPSATPAATPYDISNPRTDSSGTTTWDCIWFGNYWQSNKTAKEPIKWRVLSVDGDDAFLLADQNLDCQPYHTENRSVTWETCSLRTWLDTTFYQNAFSLAEQAAIRTTTVINEDNPYHKTEGGNDTQDKVYLLSIAEASNTAYGFNSTFDKESKTECSKNTEYAKVQGAYTSTIDGYAGNGWWWLRSPGYDANNVAYMSNTGWGNNKGPYVTSVGYAIRPALHINLSSSTWSKAGTVSLSAGSVGGVTASPIPTANPAATPAISSPTQQTDNTDKKEPTIVPPSKNTRLEDSQGETYTVTKSGSSKGEVAYTASKNKEVTSAIIPATVNLKGITYKVTSIKANAFKNCKKLKKVTLGKNIKTLGKSAFYGCAKLNSIIIKTTKLTNKSVGSKTFAKIHKKAKFKVPKKKMSAYKKLLRKKGVTGKNQVIKK